MVVMEVNYNWKYLKEEIPNKNDIIIVVGIDRHFKADFTICRFWEHNTEYNTLNFTDIFRVENNKIKKEKYFIPVYSPEKQASNYVEYYSNIKCDYFKL